MSSASSVCYQINIERPKTLNILVIGDIVGKPGRELVQELLPEIKKEYSIDVVIVNGENMAGGSGVTEKPLKELLASGVNVVTSGDHIWKKKETQTFIDNYPQLIRPANYPQGTPGRGSYLLELKTLNKPVGVVNVNGRIFMDPLDCPFKAVKREVEKLKERTNIIIVDMHAEATSEKVAMGWFLDGEVSCVFGTHTHVPTADERILPLGTAYITDVGMAGAHDSVIGREKNPVIERFLTQMPQKFDLATGDVRLNGAIISVDENTGKATGIERISIAE